MSVSPSNATFPSIEDIRSSQHVLNPGDSFGKVVRVGEFAVKFGGSTSPTEAANHEYISRNSNIPVPDFYASFSDPKTDEYFIVMQYIEGITLEKALPSLSVLDKSDILKQIQNILAVLGTLECPGYLGSAGRLPYADGVFYDPETVPPISGPFASEKEFYSAIIRRFERTEPAPFIRMLRTLSDNMPDHKIVFTHADLQPKNIILQETPGSEHNYKVVLIDWEYSGWYPEFWEFCSATFCGRFKPEWLGMVQNILPASTFVYEFLYMEFIRHLVFY